MILAGLSGTAFAKTDFERRVEKNCKGKGRAAGAICRQKCSNDSGTLIHEKDDHSSHDDEVNKDEESSDKE